MKWFKFLLPGLALAAGCQSVDSPPLATVDQVDLRRFMGDWYVIANIPTYFERGAHNALEHYELAADGTIETTFTFLDGDCGGELKRYTPRGFVLDDRSNAVWGMQFIWPIKADYRIVYLSPGYQRTVIGRTQRDYVWLMARTPSIPKAEYRRMVGFIERQGYDASKLQKVPQHCARGRSS